MSPDDVVLPSDEVKSVVYFKFRDFPKVYITLRTASGKRKIIYVEAHFQIWKDVKTGQPLVHWYEVVHMRSTITGPYDEAESIRGAWYHQDYPFSGGADFDFQSDGTMTFTIAKSTSTGKYTLLDPHHLRVEVGGLKEDLTLEWPDEQHEPHHGTTPKGVPVDLASVGHPKNFSLLLIEPGGKKFQLER